MLTDMDLAASQQLIYDRYTVQQALNQLVHSLQ
jgi:hypothetical protein